MGIIQRHESPHANNARSLLTCHPLPHLFEGDDLNEWITTHTRWLTLQISNGIPEDDERIWEAVYRSFKRRFTNTLEQEQARTVLQEGIYMQGTDIDKYVSKFEELVRHAGY